MALLATIVSGCFSASALATSSGAITGEVKDSSTHKPIEGLDVCAYSMTAEGPEEEVAGTHGCAKTSAGGNYTISELNPGSYAVIFGLSLTNTVNYVGQAYKDVSPPNEPTPVVVNAGATTGEINAELQEGSEISGRITNASTGAPVEGVLACALGRAGANSGELVACTRSAANGEYTIKGVPDGEFDILFLGAGFAGQVYPGKELLTEATVVTIAAPKEVKTGFDAALQTRPTLPGGEEPESGSSGSSGSPGLGGLPGGGSLTGPLGGSKLPVALTDQRVSVEHRTVALVKLACTATAGCRGKLILSIERSTRRKGKTLTWTVPLGAKRYSLRRGANATVKIRLDAHARALLDAARGTLVVRLEITRHASSSPRIEREHVILVEQRSKAKH
jgi:hypothetical protein